MLDFETFREVVKDSIKDYLPEEFANAEVSLNTVNKNNGKQLHAITIRTEGSTVCPNIYLEQFFDNYEHGMDIDVVCEKIAQLELEHMNPSEEFTQVAEKFRDPDFIKSHVVIAVVNAERNAEMLKDTPHKMTEDLAIIYKVFLGGDSEGIGTITIKDQHMKEWGISLDELHECAMKNSKEFMPVKVSDMGSLLSEMMGGNDEFMDLPVVAEDQMMYVISNKQNVNGAASIIYSDALEKLADKLGTDLYILPSSIHETIAISTDFGSPEQLAEMVKEVNATQVSMEEQLSDHVYKYDAKAKTLSLADVSAKELDISKVSEDKQAYEAANPEVTRPRHRR